jgi:two-component system chemotaxis sensor kinase CheA
MVGELVIAHSVVAQDQNIPKDSELQKKVNHTTKILRELQDTSLTLRMVPLRATFHKMNRLVRDLSRKAGKPVKFTTSGEDTEIDRNMVDIISEPLIHMLRNSLDHGVETPNERSKTDKDQVANINLSASQEGGKVVIQIKDDGRGIDKDRILSKALEKGLVEPDKKLTDPEIYALIFLPGLSSAEVVTDLSGRGVGMDVVRRSIEQLQGKVEVASELGVGTTITIELPFTLAITDGMLIRVGSERFIIPTINIDMTFRAEDDDLFTVLGDSEQVNFRGKSVPVIRLNRLFDIDDGNENIIEGTLLIIKNNNSRYALLVDEVLGQQQLVGKSINMIATTKHISGGAILGDGKVGLIVDTAALMN